MKFEGPTVEQAADLIKELDPNGWFSDTDQQHNVVMSQLTLLLICKTLRSASNNEMLSEGKRAMLFSISDLMNTYLRNYAKIP